MKYRWTGPAARAVLPLLLAQRAAEAGAPEADDVLQRLLAAGVAIALGPPLVVGTPGTDAIIAHRHRVEIDVSDAVALRWRAALPADLVDRAVEILPSRPRLGRSCKLGVRVSPEAAAKLRALAERQGTSEAAALDDLLCSLDKSSPS